MCRIAAYIGPEIALERLLNEPDHGLVQQSWAPREMHEARLNADGFGFGWLMADGRRGRYVNPMPIWTDPNLDSLAHALSSPLWLGNVRSATHATSVGHANTMPFVDDELIFMHNGFLAGFAEDMRTRIRARLDARFESHIHGTTDSEYLFALLRQIRAAGDGDLERSLRALIGVIEEDLAGSHALLNVVVTDGRRLVAARHAVDRPCPTLYLSAEEPRFPDAVLIASEPLTGNASWSPVAEHSLVTVEPGGRVRHARL